VPQFLRTGFKPDRWFVHPEIEWLAPGELQAVVMIDLRPTDNSLSVYEVHDGANVERIAIAVAAGKQDAEPLGYAIFDGAAVLKLGIQIEKVEGTTADDAVNRLHYDLHHLTARQLVGLADVMSKGGILEILPKRVKELVKAGLDSGHLDRRRVSQRLLAKLSPG
jgi:hypothetical protein